MGIVEDFQPTAVEIIAEFTPEAPIETTIDVYTPKGDPGSHNTMTGANTRTLVESVTIPAPPPVRSVERYINPEATQGDESVIYLAALDLVHTAAAVPSSLEGTQFKPELDQKITQGGEEYQIILVKEIPRTVPSVYACVVH